MAIYLFFFQEDVGVVRQVDPGTKEVTYNPRYEEMFAPEVLHQAEVWHQQDIVKSPISLQANRKFSAWPQKTLKKLGFWIFIHF